MRATAVMKSDNILNEKGAESRSNLLKILAAGTAVISMLSVLVGCLTLAFNSIETYLIPLFYVLTIALVVLFFSVRRYHKSNLSIIIFAMVGLVSSILIAALPEYLQGLNINGIIHRSLISGLLMLAVAIPGLCYSVYYSMGATLRAFDVSRYPLFSLPAVLALTAFALIIYYIVSGRFLLPILHLNIVLSKVGKTDGRPSQTKT